MVETEGVKKNADEASLIHKAPEETLQGRKTV